MSAARHPLLFQFAKRYEQSAVLRMIRLSNLLLVQYTNHCCSCCLPTLRNKFIYKNRASAQTTMWKRVRYVEMSWENIKRFQKHEQTSVRCLLMLPNHTFGNVYWPARHSQNTTESVAAHILIPNYTSHECSHTCLIKYNCRNGLTCAIKCILATALLFAWRFFI